MPATVEVAFTVAGTYMAYYITQVWCHGSGVFGSVIYGLYGSATLLFGMSNKAHASKIFSQYWAVFTVIINGVCGVGWGGGCVGGCVGGCPSSHVHTSSERENKHWPFCTSGLIFFYVGAASVNFTIRYDSVNGHMEEDIITNIAWVFQGWR